MHIGDCPYPGLRPFREDETRFFCGRSLHRIEMLTRLECCRFLAVIGASGSGKSSLVFAGLVPDIRDGLLLHRMHPSEGGNRADARLVSLDPALLRVIAFRPGLSPYRSLAEAIHTRSRGETYEANGPSEESISTLEDLLRRSPRGLISALRSLPEIVPPSADAEHVDTDVAGLPALVLIVDQFEEIFRFADVKGDDVKHEDFAKARGGAPLLDGTRNEAQAFIDLLLESSTTREYLIFVILTMRSDFLHRCEDFDRLPGMISEHQYLTPRLDRDQLTDSISVPLRCAGETVDDRLVTLLLNETSHEQDQLPVLQHAMARIWHEAARRAGRPVHLTVDDYVSAGGLGDAIMAHGQLIIQRIQEKSNGTLKETHIAQLFRCLGEYTPDGRAVRRPITVALAARESGLQMNELLGIANECRRTSNNFLTPDDRMRDALQPGDVLDLSHESLLRKWPLLIEWTEQERTRGGTLVRLRNETKGTSWDLVAEHPSAWQWLLQTVSPWRRLPVLGGQLLRWRRILPNTRVLTDGWARRYGWNLVSLRRMWRLLLTRIVFWRVLFICGAVAIVGGVNGVQCLKLQLCIGCPQ